MKRRTHVINVLFPDMKVIRKKLSGTARPPPPPQKKIYVLSQAYGIQFRSSSPRYFLQHQ